ncbi:MAG: primase-helicase zinc-binding domain-containing protein [Pseudomonadota bacterium]
MSSPILDLLARCVDGSRIKKASPREGGEYHSPCPTCGGRDRFMVFPAQEGGTLAKKHGVLGTWSCPRHCGTSGDIIDFCVKQMGMDFKTACAELSIPLEKKEGGAGRKYRPLQQPQTPSNAWTPTEYACPPAKWVTQATKLAETAHAALLESPHILAYLAKRGLPLEAVQRYGLGYLEGEDKDGKHLFRQRSAFGLSPKNRKDGSPIRALCIPRGITIPCWKYEQECDGTQSRKAMRIRIRRRNVDLDSKASKFQLIPQESNPYSAPMLLHPKGVSPDVATWVVVESEMDAMLVHHACDERVGAMSILTVSGKPDSVAHALLSRSARILVSIDFEQNAEGEYHTAKNWLWWKEHYPQAMLWPVPVGKDAGEAFALDLDIAVWIFASGCPVPARKQTPTDDSISASGTLGTPQNVVGERDLVEAAVPPKSLRQHWHGATAETPPLAAQLPNNAPSLSHLQTVFTGKSRDDVGLLIPCPKTKPTWQWVEFQWSRRKDCGCFQSCDGHPECIVEFLLSEHMRAEV